MAFDFPKNEEKILKFWQENRIFEKLRQKNQSKKRWPFFDGPITANNPMGVHHAWGRTYKDLFQRFMAMQGYDLRYQNGFDCQGLWVEVEVEKELGFKNKKDIEKYGIDKFVEKCKERVKKYSAIQTQQSIRLGQWMDWDNSYYTMSEENNYMIWHFLKECRQKGYLYKGRDSVPWCPRCGTAISQHEILTEEYKLLTHEAVYLKLPIVGEKLDGVKFLVWTTTPWTIPANVALAVNPELEYGIYENGKDNLLLLKDLAEKVLGKDFVLKQTFKGQELKGLKYSAPFDDLLRVKKAAEENPKTFHEVVLDKDLVTAVEGTGIVHIAPGAGEEDFKLGQREKLSVIEVIDEAAVYIDGLGKFSSQSAKENPEIILDYLRNEKPEFFFKTEKYEHRYPTCWRCKKELVWRVVDEWYIAMDKLRKPLMEAARKINWIPSFGLDRELDWLKNMHDWLISKKRYWGLALPIFECECGNFEVLGSKEELEERAIEGWEKFEGNSPHRPWVDNVKIKCSKCGKSVSRIKDVGNPWLDAGIVPFSTLSDPKTKKVSYLADKKYWKEWFPAELVCESFPGQFKNWFYSLIVMATVLEGKSPVKTVFGYATVHDENDEEMHKSKGNAIWFDDAIEKIGADPMRWMYAKQNPADNLRFGYHNAAEVQRKLLTLCNVFTFFNTYIGKNELGNGELPKKLENILDRWVISRLNNLILSATEKLEKYDAASAVLAMEDFFINDLSLWYLRRSRERFHGEGEDKKKAVQVFFNLLLDLTKLIAPVMPFFAEENYQNLRGDGMPESVHLCSWPKADKKRIDLKLESKMVQARNVAAKALAKRATLAIKVRQPLSEVILKDEALKGEDEVLELVKNEINVKAVVFDKKIVEDIKLNTEITEELEQEGIKREIIRGIRDLRKELNLLPAEVVFAVVSPIDFSGFGVSTAELLKDAGAKTFLQAEGEGKEIDVDAKKEITLRGKKYPIGIKR